MRFNNVKKGGAEYLVATLGSSSVKIYSSKRSIAGTPYHRHCVAYSEGGKRVRREFGDLGDAKTEAERILTALANGETKALSLTSVEAQEYSLAVAELTEAGVGLLEASREYRAAAGILKGKATLADAARFFVSNGMSELPRKTVPEAVTEFVAEKVKGNRSKAHTNDLDFRLKRFADKFTGQLSEVTKPKILDWLSGLNLTPRGRKNYANSVANLFRWARDDRHYLPENRPTAGEKLTKRSDGAESGEDVVIYKPAEVRTILARVGVKRPEFIPYLAIGAFAGLRTAEIHRLDWSQVDFEQGHIEIKKRNAKTRARRLVPILPNLAKWLEPYKGSTGSVAPFIRTQYLVQKEAETTPEGQTLKIDWKRNALRHSFGSYRLAITKSETQVALEMGNSPAMLYANYRGITTEAAAVEYFAIEPAPTVSTTRGAS
jgi:integrase